MSSDRKTQQIWIKTGLKELTKAGPAALRAEVLSRTLGVTKGSFYWHFEDVPDFHAKLLAHWEEATLARFNAAISDGDTAISQLRGLKTYRPAPIDAAIRAWATQYPPASKAAARVDSAILEFLSELLHALDAPHPDFPVLILATIRGAPVKGSHLETLIDLLLVLK